MELSPPGTLGHIPRYQEVQHEAFPPSPPLHCLCADINKLFRWLFGLFKSVLFSCISKNTQFVTDANLSVGCDLNFLVALPIPAWTHGQEHRREEVLSNLLPEPLELHRGREGGCEGHSQDPTELEWSKNKVTVKKKPIYEWRWERDRADWGLDYVGEGSTGVRGHNPPRFSLTSKPPAACAWDE